MAPAALGQPAETSHQIIQSIQERDAFGTDVDGHELHRPRRAARHFHQKQLNLLATNMWHFLWQLSSFRNRIA